MSNLSQTHFILLVHFVLIVHFIRFNKFIHFVHLPNRIILIATFVAMISKVIKNKIESRFGQSVRYSKDCEALAIDISSKTSHTVSGSTIKRLMGFVKGVQEPRLYTLDAIAEYLDYHSFDELIREFDTSSYSDFNEIESLVPADIHPNEHIKFTYQPNREIKVKYLKENSFEIIEVVNSKLQEGDVINFNQIVLSHPLFIKDVIRKQNSLGQYIAGKISGITSIEKIK